MPIHEAFRNGHDHIVGWFLEKEPELTKWLVKQENNAEDNPIELCQITRRNGYNECVKLATGVDMSKETEQDVMQRRIAEARNKMRRTISSVVSLQ